MTAKYIDDKRHLLPHLLPNIPTFNAKLLKWNHNEATVNMTSLPGAVARGFIDRLTDVTDDVGCAFKYFDSKTTWHFALIQTYMPAEAMFVHQIVHWYFVCLEDPSITLRIVND